MGDTTIEWTNKTWNPVTGCTKVSQGCKHCYAERVFPRAYGKKSILDIKATVAASSRTIMRSRQFTDVMCHPERLDQPLRWKKPARIFVNSMSDLFHENVPDQFILNVFDVMRQCTTEGGFGCGRIRDDTREGHIFQVLTKRPERMRTFMERLVWNGNQLMLGDKPQPTKFLFGPLARSIHLGVSCEDQETADERIPLLLQTPAAVRFVSLEPLLGPIKLIRWLPCIETIHSGDKCAAHPSLDWIIAGGESGPGARPMHPDWARSLRDQCVAAGVPFFFQTVGRVESDRLFHG